MAAPGSAEEPDGAKAAAEDGHVKRHVNPDDARTDDTANGREQGDGAEQIAGLQQALADARERLVRARADYDNLQRRVTREAAQERERNKARVLESFLPLLELAHMAAHQAHAHPSPVSEGVILLAREFDRLVEREGLQRVGTVGEAVNPARHEVLAEEPAAADAPGGAVKSGHVSRVIQPGYLLGDKVLRYAKVCIAP